VAVVGRGTVMNDNNDSDTTAEPLFDRTAISRRGAILASATVVGGGTAIAVGAAQSGRAAVSVEQLSVDDATFEAASVDPIVAATVGWAFRYDAPTAVRVELQVSDDVVASETLRTGRSELENTTELTGRVVDSDAFGASDFSVARGDSTTVDVPVTVRFAVIDGEEVVAEDTASQTAAVVVEHPDDEQYATVGGVAQITDGSE